MQDIKDEVEHLRRQARAAEAGRSSCRVVKWVDGTVLDTIWQLS
jgi:hypothetical protein